MPQPDTAPYLHPYPHHEDGRATIQCPACSSPLDPSLHRNYYDHRKNEYVDACYGGCSKEWQRVLPHLRWACQRCGWGPEDACTPPTSQLDPKTGSPAPVAVEDIPF